MQKPVRSNTKMADSMYYILFALTPPRHSYGIMKYVEGLTGGDVTLGLGTLYTTLTKLQEAKYIVERKNIPLDDERRNPYSLTKKGFELLSAEIERRYVQVQHSREHLGIERETR